ncbi:hypothetical protein CPB86DRAFT_827906 [Serendipita vermifera]|nr:hypothetical protein CPB86DRAFT_827906 [Serendipita vermifera]
MTLGVSSFLSTIGLKNKFQKVHGCLDAEISRVHALLIGISQYRNNDYRLEGAVKDAKEMGEFLKNEFSSPNIRTLYDHRATRGAIIKEIYQLGSNKDIQHQDLILIFYAGHGARVQSPADWVTHGRDIEVLVPYDSDNGKNVITDQGLAAMLEDLASVKGNNIVLILDCCHSGSMDRGIKTPGTRPRVIQITQSLSSDVDQDIFTRKESWLKPDKRPRQRLGTASHVLLAACGESELALENQGRGAFTRALLETLRSGYKDLSYSDIIAKLPPLEGQSPRCEGRYRDRLIFNSNPPKHRYPRHVVHQEDGDIKVGVGKTHGVDAITRFVLYQSSDINTSPIGIFPVQNVGVSSSTLRVPNSVRFDYPAYAIQTQTLSACFASHPVLNTIRKEFEDMNADGPSLQPYCFVGEKEALLRIDVEHDHFIFSNLDPNIKSFGFSRMPFRVRLGEDRILHRVVCAASKFNKLLYHDPEEKVLQKLVEMKFLKVMRPKDNPFGPATQGWEGRDLRGNDGNVHLVAGNSIYGIRIINKSDLQLYPHLFLFDCSDLSITDIYRPPNVNGKDHDPPLRPNGILTVGCREGKEAWKHQVRDKEVHHKGRVIQDAQNVDVGVFKLILTTKPVDLSSCFQESPFTEASRIAKFDSLEHVDVWDVMSIVVTVARP